MELTCGLRDGVSGNGTGKRHMVMGTAKLEASWLSFLPVRDKMLLRGRGGGEGGEQGKKRDNKDTKKQHITLKWLYRDSVSRKEPNPDIPHIGCSVSTDFGICFGCAIIIIYAFVKLAFGWDRNSSRLALAKHAAITASHVYLVTRSKNIKNGMFSVAAPYFARGTSFEAHTPRPPSGQSPEDGRHGLVSRPKSRMGILSNGGAVRDESNPN